MITLSEDCLIKRLDLGKYYDEKIISNTLIEVAISYDISLKVTIEEVKLDSGLFAEKGKALVIKNAKHLKDYYSLVVYQRVLGKKTFTYLYQVGTSTNIRKKNMADFIENDPRSSFGAKMLAKKQQPTTFKMEEENMYYETIIQIFHDTIVKLENQPNSIQEGRLDTNPVNFNPMDVNPIDIDPVDTNPVNTNPVDINSVGINSVDTNPIIDTSPTDTNLIDANPLDTNPIDTISTSITTDTAIPKEDDIPKQVKKNNIVNGSKHIQYEPPKIQNVIKESIAKPKESIEKPKEVKKNSSAKSNNSNDSDVLTLIIYIIAGIIGYNYTVYPGIKGTLVVLVLTTVTFFLPSVLQYAILATIGYSLGEIGGLITACVCLFFIKILYETIEENKK